MDSEKIFLILQKNDRVLRKMKGLYEFRLQNKRMYKLLR